MKGWLLLGLLTIQQAVFAQYSDVLSGIQFQTIYAELNGSDMSGFYQSQEAFFVLYQSSDSLDCMANVMPLSNSQSYGPIYDVELESLGKLDGDPMDVMKFKWDYTNTYDERSGTADVEIVLVYTSERLVIRVTIMPENKDVLIYRCVEVEHSSHSK